MRLRKDGYNPYDASKELLDIGTDVNGSQLKDFYSQLYRDNKAAILGHIYCGGVPPVSLDLVKACIQYAVDVDFRGTPLERL